MNNISGTPTPTPTLTLKGLDSTQSPTIEIIDDISFKKFMPTGITVVIDTPLAKTTNNALFAINVDGFIPDYVLGNKAWFNIHKNMFPVQNFPETLSYVRILKEEWMNPAQMPYYSHRYMRGNVGIGLRVTSNTSQSGSIIVAQASGVQRRFYAPTEQYIGLQFLNSSDGVLDYSPESFMLADLSLNRNVAITPVRKDPVEKMDLVYKLQGVNSTPVPAGPTYNAQNNFSSQFTEDWLLFGTLAGIPNSNSGQITISIFFDYSGVNFDMPLFPIIPVPPATFSKQILLVTDTLIALANGNKSDARYLPRDEGLLRKEGKNITVESLRQGGYLSIKEKEKV